jgi:uncharacterized Ntn-hydrolase superfamily protein
MTFSIAARCQRTGAFGAAISSSSPAVGSRCVWIAPGYGVVLSQNITDPAIGQAGVALLEQGAAAAAVLGQLALRESFEWRQVAVLDRSGTTAWSSGRQTLGCHHVVVGQDCVAAGNLLAETGVIDAMVAAFAQSTDLDLPQRLLGALAAGLERGGEAGPVRSAALKVCTEESWPTVDLRVDWDDAPIAALSRAWDVYRPQMANYILRARDPSGAPSFGVPGDPA